MTEIESAYNSYYDTKLYFDVNKKCSEDLKKIILHKLKGRFFYFLSIFEHDFQRHRFLLSDPMDRADEKQTTLGVYLGKRSQSTYNPLLTLKDDPKTVSVQCLCLFSENLMTFSRESTMELL